MTIELPLKVYSLVSATLREEISDTKSYTLYRNSLIDVTFLTLHAGVEEYLYQLCENCLVKKNASLIRFEPALKEKGYAIDNKYWQALLHFSKIRNCLLHGNGRIDNDTYGADTKKTITVLNSDASKILIEIVTLKERSQLRLSSDLLDYYFTTIKSFMDLQRKENKQ